MSPVAPAPRRFPWAVHWILFGLIFILGNLPIATTVISAAVANANNCTISEGLLNPCIIGGRDWGSDLQFGGMSFLYIFLTWPLALVLFIVWLIVLLVHRARFKRSNPA